MTKKRFGVDGLSRPDEGVPPAGLAGHGMGVGDVLVAGQSVTDEDGVRLLGIQRAVGLIGHGERREQLVAIEPQRLALREMHDLARGAMDLGEADIAPRICTAGTAGQPDWSDVTSCAALLAHRSWRRAETENPARFALP